MPSIDYQEMAAKYGMALSVINSDPSLKKIFDQAVAQDWTVEQFVARARETSWYKNNSESARQALILKKSDPATWTQRVSQTRAMLGQIAQQIGAPIPGATMQSLAEQALTFGWNEAQMRSVVAGYVKMSGGQFLGQAAQTETELREFARAMGVRVSDKWILEHVQQEARTPGSGLQTGIDQLRKLAVSAFPHLTDRIQAGETLESIADPYRQAMAQLLELNPEAIDMFDGTIRKALAGKGPDGKPALKTIWEFEQDLRKDPRWMKTNNAREQGMAVARQVLSDFGLVS